MFASWGPSERFFGYPFLGYSEYMTYPSYSAHSDFHGYVIADCYLVQVHVGDLVIVNYGHPIPLKMSLLSYITNQYTNKPNSIVSSLWYFQKRSHIICHAIIHASFSLIFHMKKSLSLHSLIVIESIPKTWLRCEITLPLHGAEYRTNPTTSCKRCRIVSIRSLVQLQDTLYIILT